MKQAEALLCKIRIQLRQVRAEQGRRTPLTLGKRRTTPLRSEAGKESAVSM
jgi:hypothetical protein